MKALTLKNIKESVKAATHETIMSIGENGRDIKKCINISTYVITLGHYLTDPTARRIYKESNFLGKLKIDIVPVLISEAACAGVTMCMKYKEGYDAAQSKDEETSAKLDQE